MRILTVVASNNQKGAEKVKAIEGPSQVSYMGGPVPLSP